MSKRKNQMSTKEEHGIENYYELKTEAVDRLVNAKEGNVPEIGKDEPNPYKMGRLKAIPNWLKALFIKFWFNGAACYFFYWGLGVYISDVWAIILVLGIALGIITDVMVNNIFRFMQSDEREYDNWMMIPMKKFWTFFVNILYAFVVMACVVTTYNWINELIIALKGLPADEVPLGVEPLLFGVFYLVYDLAFIGIKDLIVLLVRKGRAKKAARETMEETESEEQP